MSFQEFFQVFITSSLLPKVGVATAHYYNFNLLQTILSAGGSCILTSLLFTFFFDGAIKWSDRYLNRKFHDRIKEKKIFTKKNRVIIKVKKYFGIPGLCFIGPLFLSIPLSSFLCVRFFGDRIKTFVWLSFFSIIWILIFYIFMDYVIGFFKFI